MPMLVIAGRYDRVSAPRYALEYKKYAPQARFVMMEKSGHFPHIEEPEKTLSVPADLSWAGQWRTLIEFLRLLRHATV